MKSDLWQVLFRRLISSLIILILLVTFLFFLIRLAPGTPVFKFISPELSPELAESIQNKFDLNGSIFTQYLSFIVNTISGDFGISYAHHLPVADVISQFLPFTLIFASICFILQVGFSFILAVYTAGRRDSLIDRTLSRLSLILYSTPAFVLSLVLIYIFSVQLNFFPSGGLASLENDSFSFFGKISDYSWHLTLPVISLTLYGIPIYYNYLRGNIDSIYGNEFITFLRSHGYSERTILYKHVIPNAIEPVITVAGISLGQLFSGALIIEVIFGLPGMGRLTLEAILDRNFPLVIGCSFISGLLLLITNFIADIIKVFIDKRKIKEILS